MRFTHWFSNVLGKRRRSLASRRLVERLEQRQVLTQIVVAGTSSDLILALPESGNVAARLSDLGNGQARLTSNSFEPFDFALPGVNESLTVLLGNGDNLLMIDSLAVSQGRVTINGQEGRDTVVFGAGGRATSFAELDVVAEVVEQLRPMSVLGSARFDGADSVRLTQRENDFSNVFVRATGNVSLVDRNDLTLSAIHAGHVSVTTGTTLILTDQITATVGTVVLSTNHLGTAIDGLRMESESSISTANNSPNAVEIRSNTLLSGTGNVYLGRISAGSATGPNSAGIAVDASRGAILDANAEQLNLRAGSVLLRGRRGVGLIDDAIEMDARRVEGVSGNGDFVVVNTGGLTVGGIGMSHGVSARNGAVLLRSQSQGLVVEESITAGKLVDLKADDTEFAGDNLLIVTGVSVSSAASDVVLAAGDNLTVQPGAGLRAAGQVVLSADVQGADPGIGAQLLLPQSLVTGGGVSIRGGADSDSFVITLPDAVGSFGVVRVVDEGGQNDVVVLTGSARSDEIRVGTTQQTASTATVITRGADKLELPPGIEVITLNGGEGEDALFVQPSEFTAITVNGQAPPFGGSTTTVGDVLHLDSLGLPFRTEGPTLYAKSGSRELKGVTFAGMESVPVSPVSTSAPRRFDFNATSGLGTVVESPTEAGYVGVRAESLYSPLTGFGWDSAVTAYRLRTSLTGPFAELINDGHTFTGLGVSRIFKADVSNGWLQVTVVFGSPLEALDGLRITNADTNAVLINDLRTDSIEWDHATFPVLVTDGTLDLKFEDILGANRRVSLAGLDVRPLNLQSIGFAAPGRLVADGVSIDVFTVVNAPANGLLTVDGPVSDIVGTDASSNFDGFQILADARGRAVLNLRRPGVVGTKTVTLSSVTGEGSGVTVVDYAGVTSRKFDFNTPTSATFNPISPTNLTGYLGVLPTQTFSSTLGYGWTTAQQWTTNPAFSGSALNSDAHRGTAPGTFRVALENGVYEVHLHMGDASDHQSVSVAANGVPVVNRQRIARNTLFERSIIAGVSNGFLELTFSQQDTSSTDAHWVINALEIQPASIIGDITPLPIGEVPGNGVTVTTVRATSSLRQGGAVTVSSSLGLITSTDADTTIPGVQVLVKSGGAIEFDLQSPLEGGVPVLDWQAVDGSAHTVRISEELLKFLSVELPTRRFDFNRGLDDLTMTPTENGRIPVRPNHNNAAVDGYGWTTLVDSFYSRADPPGYPPDLVRDGARGGQATTGTFQFSAEAGSTYDVTPYIGRFSWIIDGIQVSAEGAAPVIAPATTYQTFSTVTIHGARDVNGDGLIDVTFRDTGLTNTGWTAVAMDVVRTSKA